MKRIPNFGMYVYVRTKKKKKTKTQAEVENSKETVAREEAEQMARWTGTLQRVLDLRCEGVVDEAVWSDVRGGRTIVLASLERCLPLVVLRTV